MLKVDMVVITADANRHISEQVIERNLTTIPFVKNSMLVSETTLLNNSDGVEKEDVCFFDKLFYALDSVSSEYILLMMDDFLVSKVKNTEHLEFLINELDPDYVRLTSKPCSGTKILGLPPFTVTDISNLYQINTQPSLWKKETLQRIIDRRINPWDMERFYHIKYRDKIGLTIGVYKDLLVCSELIKAGQAKRSLCYLHRVDVGNMPCMPLLSDLLSSVKILLNRFLFYTRYFK